jgi:3-phenylpropionate/cinnamic acid dioxygenase small subunit
MAAPDWDTYQRVVESHLRFARALDENDWVLYRNCLSNKITADYSDAGLEPADVDADDWTEFVRAAVSPQKTVHYFTNFQVDVDGNRASCRLNHQSSHYLATSQGDAAYVQRGTYTTELTLQQDSWVFTKIVHRITFATGNPALAGPPGADIQAALRKIYG